MLFFYSKALHIIFVVTWFAGLFYFPRLLIYATEAEARPEPDRSVLQDQLLLMQRRLWYGITWPSAIITLLLGLNTWYNYNSTPDWLVYKLMLVLGLYVYHGLCHIIFKQEQRKEFRYTSNQLRVWNEVATLFLFGIVFLVVLKDALSMLWGMLGLLALIVLLMTGIRIYRKVRER
ncbi:CopD family protein [Spirosoma aerophilum]